jgi:hypothetical protein
MQLGYTAVRNDEQRRFFADTVLDEIRGSLLQEALPDIYGI